MKHLLKAIFFAGILTSSAAGDPIAWSTGLTLAAPPDVNGRVSENYLAVDSRGTHHYVSGTPVADEDFKNFVYFRETPQQTLPLSLPANTTTTFEGRLISSPSEGVLFFVPIFSDGIFRTYCYRLGQEPSPTPFQVGARARLIDLALRPDGRVWLCSSRANDNSNVLTVTEGFGEGATPKVVMTIDYPALNFAANDLEMFVGPDKTTYFALVQRQSLGDRVQQTIWLGRVAAGSPGSSVQWAVVEQTVVDSTSQVARALSLTLDCEGRPFLSFFDSFRSRVMSARQVASGDFEILEAASTNNVRTTLAHFDELGRPAIAYPDLSSGIVRLVHFESGWSPPERIDNLSNMVSFAVDPAGYLHAGGFFVVSRQGEDVITGQKTLRFRDLTDEDGDGLNYLIEEVAGLPDDRPSPNPFTQSVTLSVISTTLNLAQNYTRDDPMVPVFRSAGSGLEIRVETSSDLRTWELGGPDLDADSFSINGRGSFFASSLNLTPPEERRFMRISARRLR